MIKLLFQNTYKSDIFSAYGCNHIENNELNVVHITYKNIVAQLNCEGYDKNMYEYTALQVVISYFNDMVQ